MECHIIIDEADVMLEKGFKDQLYEIFSLGFPETMQIALFSATLTEQTYDIANKFLRNPIKISVKKEEVNLTGIRQYKIDVAKEEHKFNTLLDIRKFISVSQAFIFCNSKQRVMTLASELSDMKQSMAFMHGDMEQAERNKIMEEFRRGTYRILISTDINARGIDVQQVSLVINYDIPFNRQNYMHRIGRCGRFGRKGVALNFVTEKDAAQMNDIDQFYQLGLQELPADLAGIFEV
jgi:translation initiation factor 4A